MVTEKGPECQLADVQIYFPWLNLSFTYSNLFKGKLFFFLS